MAPRQGPAPFSCVLLVGALLLSALTAGCSPFPKGSEAGLLGADGRLVPPGGSQVSSQKGTVGAGANAEEQVLQFYLGAEPITLDPALASDDTSSQVLNQLFEGLLREGSRGPEPGVAERWDVSPDGLVWTFHLREARWSNGDPIRAADFEFAWKRVLDPTTASPYASQLYILKGGMEFHKSGLGASPKQRLALRDAVGVKAIDDRTLRVELARPTPYFADLTTFFTLFPVNQSVVQSSGARWSSDPSTLVSNGPFRLGGWKRGSEIRLLKNSYYWDKAAVALEEVRVLTGSHAVTASTLFEEGDADVVGPGILPLQEVPRFLGSGLAESRVIIGTEYLVFNAVYRPLNDYRVRRALSLAIDRALLAGGVLKGGQAEATGLVPPGIMDRSSGRDFRSEGGILISADLSAARRLLAEAGYPAGAGFPRLTLVFNKEGNHRQVMEAIRRMWEEGLGVKAELIEMEWASFSEARRAGRFHVARGGWVADFPDPLAFLGLFTSSSPENVSRWRNRGYDKTVKEAAARSGPDRWQLTHAAERLLMEEMPVSPLYFYSRVWLRHAHVKGLIADADGDLILRNAYLASR